MSGPLLALHHVLATDHARADERSAATDRNLYFNLATDRAKSHHDAAPALDELQLLHLQEVALRAAADMVASRIRTGTAARRAPARQ